MLHNLAYGGTLGTELFANVSLWMEVFGFENYADVC
jgi:hypothetical protein